MFLISRMILTTILAATALSSVPVKDNMPDDSQTVIIRENPVLLLKPDDEDTEDDDELFLSHC